MSITAATAKPRRRPRREHWHRKFVFSATLSLEGCGGQYVVRCQTVLRRWSVTKNRFLYIRLTPTRALTLLGTDKRIDA